jgi:hypothetical protein
MNCTRARKSIIGALAAGESGIHGKLGQHLGACASCRAFSKRQASFFRDVDSHLRLVVNERVPPSVITGVLARLPRVESPRPPWLSTWRIAVAALAVLAAAVSLQLRHSNTIDRVSESPAQIVAGAANADHLQPANGRAQMTPPETSHLHGVRKANTPEPPATPEVLVSREEQEAFAHFVNKFSVDRDTAIALVTAVSQKDEATLEIALLKIQSVEVKPLEGSESE